MRIPRVGEEALNACESCEVAGTVEVGIWGSERCLCTRTARRRGTVNSILGVGGRSEDKELGEPAASAGITPRWGWRGLGTAPFPPTSLRARHAAARLRRGVADRGRRALCFGKHCGMRREVSVGEVQIKGERRAR